MMDRSRFRSLAASGREALSVVRQALLIPHDAASSAVPRGIEDGDDVVVFLHGLFSTAGVLRPLRSAVARRRVHCAAISYPPGPGIVELADRLRAHLAALPKGATVHLVGHSLGGIVARYFVVE